MILELTGLPGCGKTTVEGFLAKALQERGWDTITRECMVRRYIRDHICRNYSMDYAFRRYCTLIYHSHVWRSYLYNCWLTASLGSAARKASRLRGYWLSEDINLSEYYLGLCQETRLGGAIYLPCEGLVHHYAALLTWAGTRYRSTIDRWTRRYSSEGIVTVVLQLPFDEAFERFWRRGVPAFWPDRTKVSRAAAKETLQRFNEAIESSVDTFRISGARIISLDVSGSIAAIEDRVSKVVTGLI